MLLKVCLSLSLRVCVKVKQIVSINQQREEQEMFTWNKTREKTMENLNELLLEKCKEGNLSEVLALLDRGADIHALPFSLRLLQVYLGVFAADLFTAFAYFLLTS